jgi:hypothetical protein
MQASIPKPTTTTKEKKRTSDFKMKISTKKKLMGKFFHSKKNKKEKVTANEPEVRVVFEERPAPAEEPEGRQADLEIKPDPQTNDDEKARDMEEANEREAPEEDAATVTVETISWMGGLLENVTYICGPTPTNQPLPTIMSGEEEMELEESPRQLEEEVDVLPNTQDPPTQEEEVKKPIMEESAAAPEMEHVVASEKTKEAEEAPKVETVEDPIPAATKEEETEEEEINMEPAGTKIDIFAGFTGLCFNPPHLSMDELELKEEDAIEAAKPEKDEVTGGQQEEETANKEEEGETPSADENATTLDAQAETNGDAGEATMLTTDPTAEFTTGTIHKENKNTKMGLSLKNSTMLPGVFIAKIKQTSLFSKTDLREGMNVLKIQGKPCPDVLEDAVAMLRQAVGDLEIVAEQPKCEI